MGKTCSKCGEEKPLEDFYKDNQRKSGRRSSCKDCDRPTYTKAQRKRRKENPEKYRALGKKYERARNLRRYGLTKDAYTELLEKQGYNCAICEKPNLNSRDFHVDHCHKSGVVRGILCHHCNLLLGHAKDDVMTLENAIKYLKEFYIV